MGCRRRPEDGRRQRSRDSRRSHDPARLRPLPRPNAGTWNARGGSAAQRFDHLYGDDELREWVAPLRELSQQAHEAYAFFNNNNQTDGVAQAPAGALLLRRLLEEEDVPTA